MTLTLENLTLVSGQSMGAGMNVGYWARVSHVIGPNTSIGYSCPSVLTENVVHDMFYVSGGISSQGSCVLANNATQQ